MGMDTVWGGVITTYPSGEELKRIQGFPDEYKLFGTLTNQKKQIGNAVEVNQAKALVTANYNALCV